MDINSLKTQIESEIEKIDSLDSLEVFSVKYLSRKGIIAELISKIPSLPQEERPRAGKELNELKNRAKDLVDSHRAVLQKQYSTKKSSVIDTTLPGTIEDIGRQHPLTQVMDEICQIFISLGFRLYEGPEIETEYNNFVALNIPLDHPSADAFDTFYLDTLFYNRKVDLYNCKGSKTKSKERLLLRSHTSPGQIRVMKNYKPPVAVIVPGKVYRPDATDASHSFMFHQVEGFLVDKDVRFSDLKGVLEKFAKEMFGPKTKMRFRPHFFPFTEPSAEVDISCIICGAHQSTRAPAHQSTRAPEHQKCSVCKGKGWLEILGCGMIHPNVFKQVGYDPKKYTGFAPLENASYKSKCKKHSLTGFAFGMGVERITMLKYGIDDIRIFFENDLRFLRQF